MKTIIDVHVTWMVRGDMERVLEIEAEKKDGWSEEDFLKFLREKNCIGVVAVEKSDNYLDRNVLGFCVFEMQKDVLEIANFGVLEYSHRLGIGTKIIDRLKNKIGTRRPKMEAKVIETNLTFQHFLRANGFLATEVLRNYYDNNRDAYKFTYSYRED